MPIQHFQIYLDKEEEPYRPEEKMKGKFVVVVTDSYEHNGIYLKFEGHAMIQWTENSSCFEDSVVKQSRARRQFFESVFKYASQEHLAEGTHIFPFEYTLPENLPSSFSTPTNLVWYKMEALFNKDPKPRREVLLFSVKGELDLNDDPNLKNPIAKVTSKNLMGFFPPFLCTCHHVSIGVKILQQGFIPGNIVSCILECFSETMPLSEVTLCLCQEITLVTKEKTMIESITISKLKLPDISPEEADDYRRWEQKIAIPKDILVTSTVKEYDTVKVLSYIKFSVEASNFPYKVVSVKVPITIGTIPLIPEEDSLLNHSESFDEQSEDYSIIPRIVIDDSDLKIVPQASTSNVYYNVDKMETIPLSSDESENLELILPTEITRKPMTNHESPTKGLNNPSCSSKDHLTTSQMKIQKSPSNSKGQRSPSHSKYQNIPSHSKIEKSPSHSKGQKSPSHTKRQKSPSHTKIHSTPYQNLDKCNQVQGLTSTVGDSLSPKPRKAFDSKLEVESGNKHTRRRGSEPYKSTAL